MGATLADTPAFDALAGGGRPDDLRARIEAELAPGERLLWAGRPARGGLQRMSLMAWGTWFVALWLIIAAGLGIQNDAVASSAQDKIGKGFAVLGGFAAFFCTVAFVLTLKERWVERRRRSRVVYALSDRRAICWHPASKYRGVQVVTIPGRSIGSVHRVEYPDGRGDVSLRGNVPHGAFQAFEAVPEVRRVEALAREVLLDPDYRWEGPPAGDDA